MSINQPDRVTERTRRAFLNAAAELIMERGYDGVSVADITRRADYGRSTFYLHYADKDALAWDMVRYHMQLLDERIAARIEGMESPARLWHAWHIIFAEVDAQRPFYLKLYSPSSRLWQIQKVYLNEHFGQQLRDGYYSLHNEAVPPEIGARFVVGALLEIAEYWLQHPEVGDAVTMTNHLFRLVFRREFKPST